MGGREREVRREGGEDRMIEKEYDPNTVCLRGGERKRKRELDYERQLWWLTVGYPDEVEARGSQVRGLVNRLGR